jgi:hypothetical protein
VTAVNGGRSIRGNIIQNVLTAVMIPSDVEQVEISGNRIFNILHSPDLAQPANGIVAWGSARIYNNVIHDLPAEAAAVELQSFSWDDSIDQYVYNNLIWNIGSTAAVTVGATGGSGSNQFVYNNSIQAGGTACVQVLAGPFVGAHLTVENNHCISDHTLLPALCWSAAGGNSKCGPVASSTALTNTVMTSSAATAAGYTIANSFQPASASSTTVNVGTNLGAACASAGAALCADRLALARPGAGAWDTGAYLYQVVATAPAPLITQDPASRIVAAGQTATFSTVATGSATLTYQWQKNGVDIPGATAASFTTPAVSTLDDGEQFMVVVSNASGSASSGIAVLSVRALPGHLISSVSSFDFGALYKGTSAQSDLTFTNNGQLDVAITNVIIAGPGLHVSGLPVGTILAPGQAGTARVTFAPSFVASISGNVIIASNASNSSLAVSLLGRGVALASHGVILSWSPSGPNATGYRIYRRIDGGSYQLMNASPQPTPNFADVAVTAGQTYFYAITAVSANNLESGYSTELQVTIPTP